MYGWLIDDAGRVLVQDTSGGFNLPGGSPEPEDRDLVATLVREADEESQVVVTEAVYLGYELWPGAGREPAAYVRMVGRNGRFDRRRPDPDDGRLHGRLMTTLAEAPGLRGWGQSGVVQAAAAGSIAERLWGLPVGAPAVPSRYVS